VEPNSPPLLQNKKRPSILIFGFLAMQGRTGQFYTRFLFALVTILGALEDRPVLQVIVL
jgi:hypothetical protein